MTHAPRWCARLTFYVVVTLFDPVVSIQLNFALLDAGAFKKLEGVGETPDFGITVPMYLIIDLVCAFFARFRAETYMSSPIRHNLVFMCAQFCLSR